MSKRINVNPDHYKTAGRERQGENLTQQIDKQQFRRSRADRTGARMFPGKQKTRIEGPRKTKRG